MYYEYVVVWVMYYSLIICEWNSHRPLIMSLSAWSCMMFYGVSWCLTMSHGLWWVCFVSYRRSKENLNRSAVDMNSN